MKFGSILSLLLFLGLVIAAAWIGASFEPGDWYAELNKPAWTPPNSIFGPVWTALYLMIAVSGWLVWRDSGSRPSTPLILWAVQLLLNASWSWVFFGMNATSTSLAIILLLLLTILLFIIKSRNRIASILFIPYAIWIGFASMLNLEIVRMNV